MTYPLQFAAGALINTAGSSNDFVGSSNGYGNVQFNGLPALSNGYIVDGLETNDPLTNLNSGLSTNLVLGLNSISEVTVNTLSYAVDQGRYGASQINYITKSGTNQFHGNLYELWNGSRFNAADFFTNATAGNHKPRSTVNHFGGSIGGPIQRNKLFFFFDSEWVRIALPIISAATVPTPAFQNYVLEQLPRGGTDSVTGSVYQPAPQLVPFYQKLFALYRNTSGTPWRSSAALSITMASSAGGNPPDGNGCANRQIISHSSDDHEQVQTARLDYNINEANITWVRFQADTGVQAAYTDPINPLFDAFSPQPLYSVATGYTHVFSQNLVNYFNPAFSWYSSLFGPANLSATLNAFPIVLAGSGGNAPFTPLGGLDNTWIQGRRASRFFINDNLAWRVGAHEMRFGTNTRIFALNDYDFGEGTVPLVTYTTLPQFIYGVASTASQTFPLSNSQPYNFLNLDLYAQDTWKLSRNLTWTFGMRATHNANPTNPHNEVARLAGAFDAISHDVNQPLDQVIRTGLGSIFASTPLTFLQPRSAIAWQLRPKTVLRTGFGLFSDILPGSVVDLVGVNPPYSKTFQGGLLGTVGGSAIAPNVAASALGAAVAANNAFNSGFAQGQLSCASPLSNANSCLPPIALTAVPQGQLHAPYFMQWSFGLEQQLGAFADLRAQYVGTRAVNQPYLTQVNGYQTVCQGCFAPFPYGQSLDPRFGAVTQLNTGANSHYNGLQLTLEKRLSHGVQLQANYTWSHCMDTVSNGGFLSFSVGWNSFTSAGRTKSPIRPLRLRCQTEFHSAICLPVTHKSAQPVAELHFQQLAGFGNGLLAQWSPFLCAERAVHCQWRWNRARQRTANASLVPGVPVYEHNPIAGVTQPGTIQWLNPNAFVSTVDPSTGACVGGDRAGIIASSAISGATHCAARISSWSGLLPHQVVQTPASASNLRLDAQAFNIFYHANWRCHRTCMRVCRAIDPPKLASAR